MPSWIPSITGKVASTIGTAPRSPAHPTSADSRRRNPKPLIEITAARGRATKISTAAMRKPSPAIPPNSPGFTSRPSVRNSAIWLTQARPSWKSRTVRRLGIDALPSISAVT